MTSQPDNIDRARFATLNDFDGLNKAIGIEITKWTPNICEVKLCLAQAHLNPASLVHGGIYTTMLDVVLAMTGSYQVPPLALMPGLTLSLNIQFIAIARLSDDYLIGTARKTGGGKSIFFAEGEIASKSAQIVARGTGTFKPGRQPS